MATPQPAKGSTDGEDLSAEIIRTIDRSAGEMVTCRRIIGDRYRCNWWGSASTAEYDNPGMYGLMVTTHRVQKSSFLKVTKTANGLVYEAVGASARPLGLVK